MTPPAAAATGRTIPRTVAPRAPRRVSGPAAKKRVPPTPDQRARSGARRAPVRDPFVIRAIERTMRMADSRFLDRLIRGRLWIPLVAMGLMGIVFMQVSMLKLNAGIGRAVQASSTLERQNAKMRAEVSGMESGSKIYANAKDIGMVAPAASTTPSYVKAGGSAQATAAAHRMTPADPDAIARAKAATAAAATTTAATIGAAATGATGVSPATSTATTTAATTATGTTAAAATTAQQQAPAAQTQTAAQQQAPVAQTQAQPQQAQQTQAPPASAQTPTETPAGTQQPQTATSTSGGAVAPTAG